MYKKNKPSKTSLKINESYVGYTIEQKIERMLNNNEPLSEGAQIVYTERKDGVNPAFDIRTDRWEHAVEARDKIAKSKLATREQAIGERSFDTMTDDQKTAFHEKFPDNKFNKQSNNNQGT